MNDNFTAEFHDSSGSVGSYRDLFDTIDEGFCVMELMPASDGGIGDLMMREVNQAFERQTGLTGVVGRTLRTLLPTLEDEWIDVFTRIAATGIPERTETLVTEVGRWFRLHFSRFGGPGSGLIAVVFEDISERKQAELALQRSEERLNAALHNTSMIHWVWDAETDSVVSSETTDDVFGLLPGQKWDTSETGFALVHPEDREAHRELVEQSRLAGHGWHTEFRIVRPRDGEVRWLEERSTMDLDPLTGEPRLSGLVWDVTERKRADRLQRTSEERKAFLLKLSDVLRAANGEKISTLALRLLADHLHLDRAYVSDVYPTEDRVVVSAEYRLSDLAPIVGEYKLSDFPDAVRLVSAGTNVVNNAADHPGLSELDRSSIAALGVRAFVAAGLRKGDGTPVWVLGATTSTPRNWTAGEIALIEDVAERTWGALERTRAEAALRESEEKYRALFEGIDEAFYLLEIIRNEDGGPVDIHYLQENPTAVKRLGFLVKDRRLSEINPGFDREWLTIVDRVCRTGHAERFERSSSFSGIWHDYHVFRATTGKDHVGVLSTDITERKRAEDALRESEERLRMAMRAGHMGAWRYNIATGAQQWSDEQFDLLGLDPNARPASRDLFLSAVHPEDRHLMAFRSDSLIPNRRVRGAEFRIVKPDGEVRWLVADTVVNVDASSGAIEMIGLNFDITERKRAEQQLQQREERQAFLLEVSDAFRAAVDADAISQISVRMLAEHLHADRVFVSRRLAGDEFAAVGPEYRLPDLPPVTGTYRHSDFPDLIHRSEIESIFLPDAANAPDLSDVDKASIAQMGIGALMAAPIREGERNSVWALSVASTTPRDWTRADLRLVEDVAERTWTAIQRAQSELALRESEERFRRFAAASSDVLWIRNGTTLELEFLSDAFERIYGLSRELIQRDMRYWASLVVPEDRDWAVSGMVEGQEGRSYVREFRIQRPSDGTFRWIHVTGFPLLDSHGGVERIAGIGSDITDARELADQQAVLVAELQHRVRNILAMIRSMTARTAATADTVADYAELMSGRLMALSRVQVMLTRGANAGGGISDILRDEIDAQAQHAGQYALHGPDVLLPPKVAEVFTLAVHELATNALKYGALKTAEGRVAVTWSTLHRSGHRWLCLDWRESAGTTRETSPTPQRRGFGMELIEQRIPYELGGMASLTMEGGGMHCHLEFPVAEGASILETTVPKPVKVSGGSLDMTGTADLAGHRILVVEDDYYLASDAARAVVGAGGEVVGPCPTEEAALGELEMTAATGALVDINLGRGPSFSLTRTLVDRKIPLIFITGYDDDVIPSEFDGIPRLQKPVNLRQVIATLATTLGRPEQVP